ncbi:nodulation protein NodZ [Caldimonas sp. KR1-144]|uniref:nodulation protein NodZ n=1 Tax=Caldimonas sp. KR1-144 TaxID=3400911 RepID=UPI003C076549
MRKQFVLVKSYYGLGGDICVMLGAWRLARQLGRELIVDWSGGRYGRVSDGKLFARFFTAPHFLAPVDVPGLATMSVFPGEWAGRAGLPPVTYLKDVDLTKSRPDDVPPTCDADCIVISRDSQELLPRLAEYAQLARGLRLVDDIQASVDRQLASLKPFRHSIGIHFRHGNGEKKVMAPDPRWFRNRISGKLKSLNLSPDDMGLYVATDCGGTLDYFKHYYPNVIALPKIYRPNGSGALHVGRDDLSDDEKVAMAGEALADIYCLAKCNSFIGSRGYFSLLTRLLRGDHDSVIYSGARVVNSDDQLANLSPAIGDPVFGLAIRRVKIPTDGLMIDLSGTSRTLHYYEDTIMSVPASQAALTNDEQISMRRLVSARRTY